MLFHRKSSTIFSFPDSFQDFLSLLYKHLLFRFFFIYLPEPLMQSLQIPDISLCVICQHPEKREDHRMPDILPSQYRLPFLSIHFIEASQDNIRIRDKLDLRFHPFLFHVRPPDKIIRTNPPELSGRPAGSSELPQDTSHHPFQSEPAPSLHPSPHQSSPHNAGHRNSSRFQNRCHTSQTPGHNIKRLFSLP